MGQSRTKRLIAVVISGAVALSLLCVAAWMVLGGENDERAADGIQIIAPVQTNEPNVGETSSDPTSVISQQEVKPPEQITVYITGEVVDPGVYTISKGERLDAVLRLAGGATENADLRRVNLAAYAADAAHYHIPETGMDAGPGETPGDASTGKVPQPTATEACQTPVDINTAGAQCLETLPGIGGVRAQSIVTHREQAGPFASPEAITEVSGIGDGIYRRIADMITVGPR